MPPSYPLKIDHLGSWFPNSHHCYLFFSCKTLTLWSKNHWKRNGLKYVYIGLFCYYSFTILIMTVGISSGNKAPSSPPNDGCMVCTKVVASWRWRLQLHRWGEGECPSNIPRFPSLWVLERSQSYHYLRNSKGYNIEWGNYSIFLSLCVDWSWVLSRRRESLKPGAI